MRLYFKIFSKNPDHVYVIQVLRTDKVKLLIWRTTNLAKTDLLIYLLSHLYSASRIFLILNIIYNNIDNNQEEATAAKKKRLDSTDQAWWCKTGAATVPSGSSIFNKNKIVEFKGGNTNEKLLYRLILIKVESKTIQKSFTNSRK